MIDWSTLRPTQKGLAVEGDDDKRLIEAFLEIGQTQGLWQGWHSRLMVAVPSNPSGFIGVLREVAAPANQGRVWGLIDRDWRTANEVRSLQSQNSQLLVLPRVMIENYCIHPDELLSMLPETQRAKLDETRLRAEIESGINDWIKHGALSAILYESGANEFCRGSQGYPGALISSLVIDEAAISQQLRTWHAKLKPTSLLRNYRGRVKDFQSRTVQEHCWYCVDGKMFFNEVVQRSLNRLLGQHDRDFWFTTLVSTAASCPTDIVPLLTQLLI